jgi:hypothetical protein
MGIPVRDLGGFICVQPLKIGFRLSMALRRCFNPVARFSVTPFDRPQNSSRHFAVLEPEFPPSANRGNETKLVTRNL